MNKRIRVSVDEEKLERAIKAVGVELSNIVAVDLALDKLIDNPTIG